MLTVVGSAQNRQAAVGSKLKVVFLASLAQLSLAQPYPRSDAPAPCSGTSTIVLASFSVLVVLCLVLTGSLVWGFRWWLIQQHTSQMNDVADAFRATSVMLEALRSRIDEGLWEPCSSGYGAYSMQATGAFDSFRSRNAEFFHNAPVAASVESCLGNVEQDGIQEPVYDGAPVGSEFRWNPAAPPFAPYWLDNELKCQGAAASSRDLGVIGSRERYLALFLFLLCGCSCSGSFYLS